MNATLASSSRSDRPHPTVGKLANEMRSQARAEQEKYGKPNTSSVKSEPVEASNNSPGEQVHAEGIIAPLSNESGVDIVKWGKTQPPPRKFIVEDKIPENTTAVLNSSGGVGKSNLLTLVAFCVAAGVSVDPFTVKKARKVFLLNVEDSELDQWRRVHALYTVYPVFHDYEQKIRENLILYPGLGKVSPFMKLDGGNPVVSQQGEWLRQSLKNIDPALAIFDTKARLYGLDENNNDHAAQWWGLFESIMQELTACTPLVASHSGKAMADSATQHSNRGASAFIDNARLNIVLNHMSESDAKKFDVERRDYFTMSIPKFNYGRQPSKIFFEKTSYEGVPRVVDLVRKNFSEALDTLVEYLKKAGGSLNKRELLDRAKGKEIRSDIKKKFGINKNAFFNLVEFGIESLRLTEIKNTVDNGRNTETSISVRRVSVKI
jgi:hypothetical protein